MTKQELEIQNSDLWYRLDKAYAKIEKLEEEVAYYKDLSNFYKREGEYSIEELLK